MTGKRYKVIDYKDIPGVSCPCGTARRGLYDVAEFPGTLHRTDIDQTATAHYHAETTEVYYIISCESGAIMYLDGNPIELHEEMAIYIPPHTVHYLDGKAKVLLLALPKFNPADEFVKTE